MNKVIDLDPKNLDTVIIPMEYDNHPYWYDSQVGYLYSLYRHLLPRLKACLTRMGNNIKVIWKAKRDDGWNQYLPILKQLHYISQLYEGTEETFCTDLRPNKVALCYLIVRYAKRDDDDYKWILNRKDLTSFETKRRSSFYPDNMFVSCCVPEELLVLYESPHDGNKERAQNFIQDFITSIKHKLKKPVYHEIFAPIVLQFCKLLRHYKHDDPLYIFCRTTLESMLNETSIIAVQDIFPFFDGLATELSKSLVSSMESTGPSSTDVHEFNIFLRFMMNKVVDLDPKNLDTVIIPMEYDNHPYWYDSQVGYLYSLYRHLLPRLKACLTRMGNNIKVIWKAKRDDGWDQYLPILKQLHYISQLYEGTEETFWTDLRPNKVALCYLIVRYAKRGDDDYKLILNRKDLTSFETRRHLVMMLFPDVTRRYCNSHTMFINRSNLLTDSINESIKGVNLDRLRGPISISFTNEEARGPGVLHEWFMLVCQAIFNPQNALFLACPTDRRRFFPNPASKINSQHLEYFRFAGRVIALALTHKMQVGIVFSRTFFLQLAGIDVSLEDIKDADSYLYDSCKQILEMDPCVVDQDVLGLTFTWEVDEFGSKKVVELLPDGKEISVNSKNRELYIDHVIRYKFVTSISQQVSQFSQGFVDIVTNKENMKLCFEILELEYLDGMLRGSESDISVDDWKAHIQYKGYLENDPQIYWFWRIVGEMNAEQRKVLLFFWTSMKYVPFEGFHGLDSRLYIIKSDETCDCLPYSHTCFYEICIPAYPSMDVMQQRLNIITQEHVAYSFGLE